MWNRTEDQIKLVLIRHGATRMNLEHRYIGTTDEQLSEQGRSELCKLRKTIRYPKVEHLFVSPMKRCMETADLLYPKVAHTVIRDWREIDFGEFEGKNYLELQENKRYQEWLESNGTLPFPNGESRERFIKRCEKGFCEMVNLIQKESTDLKTIGAVVHGGTIMAILSRFCGGEYFDYQAENGKGYVTYLKRQKEEIQISISEKL